MITTYHIISKIKEAGSAREELKHYTFGMLKEYFEPDREELPDVWEAWNNVEDIFDLRSYLQDELGINDIYIEEDEIEDMNSLEKANKFFAEGCYLDE